MLRLGASLETMNVELLKVGETCEMAIPSQASKDDGVETRRAASKGRFFLWWRDSPAHKHSILSGSENYSVMNLEVAGSSPAAITILIYLTKKVIIEANQFCKLEMLINWEKKPR